MMEHLNMQSMDKVAANVAKIRELFPNCVTERINSEGKLEHAIDFDMLKQELSDHVVDGLQERYQFTWPDKRKAILAANAPINKTLRPCREESVDFDNTENLYIEGDNLEVLKLLQETYLGKVKMIYIDPPYNTGNDFVYRDEFKQKASEYKDNSGQYDEEGNQMVTNTESNGRFHTDWLNMMYPRLKLAKDLLDKNEGVIFISIDESEHSNLKKICDEIFGEDNFIAELVWAAGRKNDSKHISISHEYILAYFKNSSYIYENKVVWRERKQGLDDIYSEYEILKRQFGSDIKSIEKNLKDWYKALPDVHPAKDHSHYCRVDEKGIFFADNISWPGGGGPKYEVLHPVTHKPVKIPSRGWLTNEDTLKEWIKQGRVSFGDDENSVPTLKAYLKDREYSVPYSVFYKDGRASSKRLAALMGNKVFENPKDEELIQRLIEFCGTDNEDIILDFFSGSATTAHSVFLANFNQNIKRKFILVQIQEEIFVNKAKSEKSKKVAKNAIELLDSINKPHNICEIGKERIRRAGQKIKEENPLTTQDLDIGFRVLKCDSSNMEDVYFTPKDYMDKQQSLFVDNIKKDRSDEDLLFDAMLKLDTPLSSKIERITIAGKTVYNVAQGHLMACFDKNVTDEVITAIAKEMPSYFVMRDSSQADDSVAINFEQIFNTYSPQTVRRVL